ncbi:hypothetical protein SAMN05444266_109154 [Chitinophaga jiangningensis]|uniref:Uncharacterized protein n=1 Tax=Chitinophaga jiangningensis TaxID=1419482 RepID=A0A1M7K5M2_9BACT|nr:hypothetical protein [Chitinophaga jiangningensis]SHM60293.1 hypothetical protein SAMN05444266_109154 [Chitinophaga jiangningensis]
MRKTSEKKLSLSKIKVSSLNTASRERDAKAPTYTGCSLFAKCTPPSTKASCI